MHAAAHIGVRLVATRRGRRLLLAVLAGLIASLLLITIVLLSSVSATVGTCRQEASTSSSSGSSGDASPTLVSQKPSEQAVSDIPQDYLSIYQSVAKNEGLDWAILAAIGKEESDDGRLDAPGVESGENSAGAGGPMQFLASTWANSQIGADGNGDGVKDRYDPEDAIAGAANYLKLEGAPDDYHSAILAYNQSEAYYQGVVAQADEYRAATGSSGEDRQGGEKVASSPAIPSPAPVLGQLLSPLSLSAAHAETDGTVGNPGETSYTSAEIDTLNFINEYREENGLQALQLSDRISTASAHYAHDMAKYDAYRVPEAHVSGPTDYYFEGAMLTDRMNAEGYYGSDYGENIAAGQATSQEVFDAWRNSPPHNEMMLNPEMGVIGIGLVENPETSYEEFWVTNFGSDADETTRPVSEAGDSSGGGSGVEDSSGVSGSDSGGEVQASRAVFPLPDDYFDSYEDTWGAARDGGRGHEGTDMFASDGTPIYSVTAGKVVPVSGSGSQGWNEFGGWTVMVEATENVGPIKAGDTLYYAHMVEPSSLKPGDTVEAGDAIGKVGSTGEGPAGSILPDGRGGHLHLGWYDPTGKRAEVASGAMNPYPLLEWLRENGGAATGTSGGVAPGVPTANLPAYCKPLQAVGLVPTVAPSGSPPAGEAVPTSFSGGGNSGEGSGTESGSGTGQQVVKEALKYEGTPYVLGGPEACIPGEQMDCTCLTTTVFREFGFELPDMPTSLMDYGEPVEGPPQAGDVHVWDDPGDGTGGHVAIDMGDGNIVHANMATMSTAVAPMYDDPNYLGARRLVN